MRRRATRQAMMFALALGATAIGDRVDAQTMVNVGGATFNTGVRSLRDMPFKSVVRQQYDYSCGSAALATLLDFHFGARVTEADVFVAMYAAGDQPKIRQVGFSLLDMKRYLTAHGYPSDGYKDDLQDLVQLKSPAIAVVQVGKYRHFVVIKGVSHGEVMVGDPALGLKVMTLPEFGKIWSGILFMIHPSPAHPGAFNQAQEWESWPRAPMGARLDDRSLGSLTRGLPPIYQITPVIVVQNGLTP